jgi:molybdopterin/thiamine biosynthesis adenylyltransferase
VVLIRDEVLKEIERTGLLLSPRRISPSKTLDGIEGEIVIDGQEATLQLILDRSFPLTLPRFLLKPWDALGFIPHVDQDGVICFADREGLIVDRHQPVALINEAFHRVLQLLTDGVRGANRRDFVDEFEAYWNRSTEQETILSTLDAEDHAGRVVVAFVDGKASYVAQNEQEIRAFLSDSPSVSLVIQSALYLPLQPGTVILPPRPDQGCWSIQEVREILLANLSVANQRRAAKLLKRRRIDKYVIAKLPRPAGGYGLFGFRFEKPSEIHPLQAEGSAERLIPLSLVRLDRKFLTERGGGNSQLAEKRVLLVGCGAVGSQVASLLTRAGILNLTLLDNDYLEPVNTFRHVLGRQYWGKPKAEALKAQLAANLPYVSIQTVVDTVENAVTNGIVMLSHYDLVILATGNPTVELYINELIFSQNRAMALFTWLEPLGIGGHALLVHPARGKGCLECLYTNATNGERTLQNRASFAAPDQYFGRDLSGCASLFTPYGTIDAANTANLAARLAVDALSGKEDSNPLLSWKGDEADFQSAGFRVSSRYGYSSAQLHEHRYSYYSSSCRICACPSEED